MSIILFIISLLLPAAAGFVILCGEDALSPGEKAIFSLITGSGLLAFYLFSLGVSGLHYSFFSIAPFFVVFAIAGFVRRTTMREGFRQSAAPSPGLSRREKIFLPALLGLVLFKTVYAGFIVSSVPTIFWDAYTLWNLKAKEIFYSGGSAKVFFGGQYGYYPLGLPLIRAWTALVVGYWSSAFVNLREVVSYVCLLGLVFLTLKRAAGTVRAGIFTYVLSALPIVVHNAMSGYADMAVGYYYLAAAVMLYRWHKTGRYLLLISAGLIASIAMFTKNEGIAIVFPGLVALFIYSLIRSGRSWRYMLGALFLFVVSSLLILTWLVKSEALSAIVRIAGVERGIFSFHPEGIGPLFEHLFIYGTYNIFWAGLLLVAALRFRRIFASDALFFFIPSVVSLVIIIYVFLFTKNVAWLLNGTTINRTVLIVIPLLTVAAGFLAGEGSGPGACPEPDSECGPRGILEKSPE